MKKGPEPGPSEPVDATLGLGDAVLDRAGEHHEIDSALAQPLHGGDAVGEPGRLHLNEVEVAALANELLQHLDGGLLAGLLRLRLLGG